MDYKLEDEIYDFVIIANEVFYEYDGVWDLSRLVDWHNNNDTLSTYLVNLSTIYLNNSFWVNGSWGDNNQNNPFRRDDEDDILNYDMFNDSAAKIRNYLRYAYSELGVRYALVVGDTNGNGEGFFPVRYVYSRGYGAPASGMGFATYYEVIPTDVYYACLNGTFNSDEDLNDDSPPTVGGWGENATESSDNIDECDWIYEIAIGRFPVDNFVQLENAVRKTICYMQLDGDEDYLFNVTLAGHYAGWGGDAEWGANYSKTTNGTTYTFWNNDITYGFNSSIFSITVIDANPDRDEGIPYTDTNSRGQFNKGCHIWYQGGHGSSNGWSNAGGAGDSFSISDIQALTNSEYSLILSSIPCNTANFDNNDDCFIEQWLTDEHGAFAAIGNTRYGWGSYDGGVSGYWDGLNASSHFLLSQFLDAYFNPDEAYSRIGDCLFDGKQESQVWHDEKGDGTIRWAMYEQILMGSPAVKLKIGKPSLSFSMNLEDKWNFVSLPLNISSDFKVICIIYNETIYNWTEATSSFNPTGFPLVNSYVFNWDRNSQKYNFTNSFEPGYGYWMYVYEPCILLIENITFSSDYYITCLEENWNIIGLPNNFYVNKSELLVNDIVWDEAVTDGMINDYVFGWDSIVQTYDFVDTFIPSFSYWMYAYADCILKIQHG
jgi:hypothetical protein